MQWGADARDHPQVDRSLSAQRPSSKLRDSLPSWSPHEVIFLIPGSVLGLQSVLGETLPARA